MNEGDASDLLRGVLSEQAVRPQRQDQDYKKEHHYLSPLRLPEVDEGFENAECKPSEDAASGVG